MLPPFAIQSEDIRAMARHCTVGIEPRISAERLILLDTQVQYFLFWFKFILDLFAEKNFVLDPVMYCHFLVMN